jgi:hypothetical protein
MRKKTCLAAKELLQQLLHLGDAGGATDEHNVVDLSAGHAAVAKHLQQ